MGHKTCSVLFCALLASSLVHELRAKTLAAPAPQLKAVDRVERSITVEVGLSIQVVAEVLVIQNSTANAVLLIDVSANIFVLLNGTTGAGVIIDRNNSDGIFFESGLWIAAKVSLVDYIKGLTGGLADLLKLTTGTVFKLLDIATNILEQITYIVAKLVKWIEDDLLRTVELALNLVLTVVDEIVELEKGVLAGLLKFLKAEVINLKFGLAGLVSFLNGLELLLTALGRTLDDLVDVLEARVILEASNGLAALTSFLGQLKDNGTDLTPLSELLNDPIELCEIIHLLGGLVLKGITGILNVVGKILNLIEDPSQILTTINALIQYVVAAVLYGTDNLLADLKQAIADLLEVVESLDIFKDLVDFLNALLDSLVVGGIKLYAIVQLLIDFETTGPIEVIIKVLQLLSSLVELVLSVVYLLLVLIAKLINPLGIKQLGVLGVDISSIDLSLPGNLLGNILTAAISVISFLLGDIYTLLKAVPIPRSIVNLVEKALLALAISINLKTALAGTIIKNLFLALLKLLGVAVKTVPTTAVETVEDLLYTLSLDVALNLTIVNTV